jgi:hypothetical protein
LASTVIQQHAMALWDVYLQLLTMVRRTGDPFSREYVRVHCDDGHPEAEPGRAFGHRFGVALNPPVRLAMPDKTLLLYSDYFAAIELEPVNDSGQALDFLPAVGAH